jgi:hypothetical protein
MASTASCTSLWDRRISSRSNGRKPFNPSRKRLNSILQIRPPRITSLRLNTMLGSIQRRCVGTRKCSDCLTEGRPGPRLRRPLCRVADLANPSYCSRIDLQGDRVCARGRRAGRSRHLALSRSAAGGVSAPVDPADGPARAARRRGAAGLAEPRQATVSRGSIAARFNRDACLRKGTSCQGAGQSTFRHRRTSARTRPCSRSTARRPRR